MSGPGQRLEQVLENVGVDSVASSLEPSLLILLSEAVSKAKFNSAVRSALAVKLRQDPIQIITNYSYREMLIDALTSDKRVELTKRLGLSDGQDPQDSTIYSDIAKAITLAGFFGLTLSNETVRPSAQATSNLKSQYGLFDHQRSASNRVWAQIGSGHGRTILHMPTGAGKTRTAMHIVCRFLQTHEPTVVVWLASSSELLDQAADAITQAWSVLGNRPMNIHRAWGDYTVDVSSITDGVIIGGFQKLHYLNERSGADLLRLSRNVGLVVVDEAHQSIAPTFSKLIDRITGTGKYDALLGLTATPGRTWEDIDADAELAKFYDNRKVMLEIEGFSDPVEYLMTNGYLARPDFRRLHYTISDEDIPDLLKLKPILGDYDAATLSKLAMSSARNRIILDEIDSLIAEGHTRIILFASTVDHAKDISAVLSVKEVASEVVTGETPSALRSRAISRFRSDDSRPIVMCNYGVLTTGFDAPKTSAAIIARPTRSLVLFSQMVGRATRGVRAGGNETCVVSTVVDVELPGFRDVAEAFMNWEDVYDA
ncbi:DEAD/DEAH box helicase [Hyphomonas oceanitis]|uniref:Type III restriction protein res subunit n=1 Tax=Hyphomonas oceanitis SCH89 TaxID=1280953 RepID=A0A059G1H1_9PROT|nr:DEAD/DEAH box helicase [Hyphomonas oceanitis]KDA00717.1 type III restriction protein res subunit [Hyphomonas oceanitis SCH89]